MLIVEFAAKLEQAHIDRVALMSRVVSVVEGNVKRVTPVRTGTLRRSITSRVERGGLVGRVGTNLSYARAVHDGTRPHIITPKRARALRFKIGGNVVYATRVRHPGTRGNPYLRNGLEDSIPAINQLLRQAAQEALR